MYKEKHIGVVIPAYNEEEFVEEVIETVPAFVDRIYPVDDCSTDKTWARILLASTRENSQTQFPQTASEPVTDGGYSERVVPIRHSENRGVGGAIKTGYRRAVDDGLDVVAVMNADGQMDPDILDRILDPVVEGDADYAKGNRLVTSSHWKGMTRFRLFGNYVLTYLTRIASGYWHMTDPQNGYTAVATDALEEIDLTSLYDGYGFLNDMLIRLNVHNMRIADVEMTAVYGDESSSIRYHRFVPRLSRLLLKRFLWRLQTKYASGDRVVTIPYFTGITSAIVFTLYLAVSIQFVGQRASLGGLLLGLFVCLMFIGLGMAMDRRNNSGLEMTVRK